jgi:hypothetical protein
MKITQGHGADVVYDPVGMIAWSAGRKRLANADISVWRDAIAAPRVEKQKPEAHLLDRTSRTWRRWVCTGAWRLDQGFRAPVRPISETSRTNQSVAEKQLGQRAASGWPTQTFPSGATRSPHRG